MESIEKSGIKISNAVVVSGVTETEQDSQITDFLKKYGCIERILPIYDSESEHIKNLVIELESGQALEDLRPLLPLKMESHGDPTVIYEIEALGGVYTAKVARKATREYQAKLRDIAKLTGTDYVEVVRKGLSQSGAMKPIDRKSVV